MIQDIACLMVFCLLFVGVIGLVTLISFICAAAIALAIARRSTTHNLTAYVGPCMDKRK